MIAMQVARIIGDFMVFLNLTDEDLLNPDTAVDVMEDLANNLELLDKHFLRELVDAFPVIALEYSGEAQQLVRNIPYSFYLEEELAADDPVRLAELEALRDARDEDESLVAAGSEGAAKLNVDTILSAEADTNGH